MTLNMANINEFMSRELDAMNAEALYRILYGDGWPFNQPPGRPDVPNKAEYVAAHVAAKAELRRLDREVGPILGPGRTEWQRARRPYNRNRAIRNTMPGKTPLEFVPARRAPQPVVPSIGYCNSRITAPGR